MIDYKSIATTVINMIKEKTNHNAIVENGTGKQPEYPFCTFTITSPYLSLHQGIEEEDTLIEDVDIIFSLTWISKSHYEAISLAQQTATYFKSRTGRETLADAGLVWVKNEGFGNRDTFITIDTERRHGFDLRLRTRTASKEDKETDYFDGISLNYEGG